jgi:hypothetical protein
LQAAGTCAAHFSVIHPEGVFGRRHQYFGIGISERVVVHQQTVDVIAVIVRDNDSIDSATINACCREIGDELAADPAGFLVVGVAVPVSMTASFEPVFTAIGL